MVDMDGTERGTTDEPLEGPVKGTRGLRGWVRSHPWTTATAVLVLVAIIVLAVVLPVCLTGNCGSKETATQDDTGALTLILRFNVDELDALDIIPAVLRPFTDRLLLNSSSIQILNFTDEAILRQARIYLQQHPDLDFLLRDFGMRILPQQPLDNSLLQSILNEYAPPGTYVPDAAQQQQVVDVGAALLNGTTDLQDALNQVLSGSGGRRKLNQALGTAITPNDPFFNQQWFHTTVKTPSAWSASTGASTIIVAVIDSGTDLSHPDLKNNLWNNPNEIPDNGIDDDGNGYVDDYYGYDFAGGCLNNAYNTQGFCIKCTGQPNPNPFRDRDTSPHGTHVAGLIAALQNNGVGVTGVAPVVRIMTLKVDNCVPSNGFATSSILSAFDYAFRMGAHIVSCSFGPQIYSYSAPQAPASVPGTQWYDPNQAKYQQAYIAAITPLANKSVLVVAAAGNEYTDLDRYTAMGFFYGPCNTPLPNILCVGASGPTNTMLAFSNYGNKTVDVVAPGQSIYSTWQTSTGQFYGTYSGTSQATPIVSGIAALVLATLSAVDGSMLRAAQLKDIIMSSGDYVASLTPVTVSSARANAANAVLTALRINTEAGLLNLAPMVFNASQSSILSSGLSETYYSGPAVGSLNYSALPIIDVSTRLGPSTVFPSFKFPASMVSVKALMYVPTAGLYNMQVTTTLAASKYAVSIGGAGINITNGLAMFVFTAKGYFKFELIINAPSAGLALTWKVPGSTTFQALSAFYINTSTVASVPSFAKDLTLATGFQLHYNSSTTTPTVPAVRGLSTATNFASTLIVADLNFAAGAFKSALFPGGTSANMAIGVATTMLVADAYATNGPFRFKISCKGCRLLLNDLLLIDNWESNVANAALTKTSGCVNLTNSQMYNLTVVFAPSDLAASPMMLTMSDCGNGTSTSLAARTSTPLFWSVAGDFAGWIGGLQCDVWRNASFGVNGSAPTFKVRVPKAATKTEFLRDTTTAPFAFTLDSLLPGLAAAYPVARGGLFSVRCWTYWDTAVGSAKLTAPVSGTTQASVYLAGRKVAGSGTGGTLLGTPTASSLAGNRQLLAVEWTAVTSLASLSLQLNGVALTINLKNMLLPLPIVPLDSGVVGTPGHFSVAYQPSGVDVAELVQTDMAEFPTGGYVTTNTAGLDYNASYWRTTRTNTRYARSSGYFVLSLDTDANFTMQVTELAKQSSTVIMGDVTVKNGAPFSGNTTAAATYSFEVFLPVAPVTASQVLHYATMTMIVKSATPDSSATFSMDVLAPADYAGPMDTQVWFRAATDPVN